MRLLVICENFTMGGLETQVASTLRMLMGKDVEVFFSTSPGYNRELLDGLVEDVLELNFLNVRGEDIAAHAKAISQFIKKHSIDVIHLHPFHSFWSGYLAVISAGKPYVCTVHGPWSLSPSQGLAYHLFQKHYLFPHASAVIVVSRELQRWFPTVSIQTPSQPLLFPNAVDTDHFSPTRTSKQSAEKRIALVSRLDHDKLPGVRSWLRLCHRLMEILPSLVCLIVGDGPGRQALEKEVKTSGFAKRIRFLGYTNDVRSTLQSCSLAAGMGRLVLEAASMDLPVVLVGYDEVKVVVDADNFESLTDTNFSGRGIGRENTEDLVKTIERCLRRPAGKYKLREQVLANHNAKRTAETYWQTLCEIVEGRQRYAKEVHVQAQALEDNLGALQVSLFDAMKLLDIFPQELLEEEVADWSVWKPQSLFLQKEREWEQIRKSLEQNLADVRQHLAAEGKAHQKAHQDLIAVGDELVQERHELMQQRERLAAERQAHHQTYQRVIEVGDELVGEREQLGTERQAHNKTLHILQEIYASRGWQWLERYRRFKQMVLLGTLAERRNYFRHVVKRFVPNLTWRAGKNATNHFPVDPHQAHQVTRIHSPGPPISVRSSRSVAEGREILRSILSSHVQAKAIVVYPPTIDWNYPLFQRPHHIALGLAQRECVFLYMSPNLYDNVDGARKIAQAVYVLNLPLESFQELSRDKTVLYISWAANYRYREIIPHRFMIYDYLDTVDLSDTPSQKNIVLHTSALRKADVVLTTAKNLYSEAKEVASKVILCPNGVECEHFDRDSYSIPEDLQHILDLGEPIIGYYGAVATWLDYSLLKTCAMEYPRWQFVLIGLDYDGSLREAGITALPNVHHLGSKSYQVLPHYLHGFSVATIPFCLNRTTLSTSPIKLFEYMAGGKPIVTTALPECQGYESVLWSQNQDAYLENLGKALKLSKDEANLSLLKAEARENSWDKRVRQIVNELSLPSMS